MTTKTTPKQTKTTPKQTNLVKQLKKPEEMIIESFQNGNLLTRGRSQSGNIKTLSIARISKYLALPLESITKPFRFNLGELGKYLAVIKEFQDDKVHFRFFSENPAQKVKTFSGSILRSDEGFWVYSTEDESSPQISYADSRKLAERVYASAHNIPLIHMYKQGKVSDKNLAIILYAYLQSKASKLELTLNREVMKALAQVLYTVVKTCPEGEYFTVKELLESYLRIDWDYVKQVTKETQKTTQLLNLPG
jgi:hypothetical protein